MDKGTTMRSVRHAAELAGGPEALARRLNVSLAEVLGWAEGARKPDTTTFLRVLDVVITDTRKLSSEAMAFGLAELVVAKAARGASTA